MRQISILELKRIVDQLYDQHPMAIIDFVYPKRRGEKWTGALGQMTTYSVLLDSSEERRAIVRFYLNHAREERYQSDTVAEPSVSATLREE